jgi:hypothetical protein
VKWHKVNGQRSTNDFKNITYIYNIILTRQYESYMSGKCTNGSAKVKRHFLIVTLLFEESSFMLQAGQDIHTDEQG